ncbi:NAD-dependent protein deacylase [Peribacillus glennii]|uniref:protein acetyllysine N-acetyltransferase n=1 Tax=Peribacillus glennii TaxID=2303991 RepID=A0A372LIV8_9BACI|nr:NAD-dependent protein deacylase [Peribacillus glennii]RFU65902.1 NAD-dependent protein deacylase [Peribacillus glennii]
MSSFEEQINMLKDWIDKSERIAVLTGAGVSTESGLKDFRSDEGIFAGEEPIEYYLSRPYFNRQPTEFWKKYKRIFHLGQLHAYQPSLAHTFLAGIERKGKNVTIITQNVDGLHQKAGSRNVIEVHGAVTSATCPKCGGIYDFTYIMNMEVPVCKDCERVLNPDIVLYGDEIHGWEEAEKSVMDADLFLVMGTSLSVTPVNMFPSIASLADVPLRGLLNNEPTIMDRYFDLIIEERLGTVFEALSR